MVPFKINLYRALFVFSWLRQFLAPSGSVSKRHLAFWTILSGGCYAGFSFFGLFLVSHLLNAEKSGLFVIALTIAQQLFPIGLFCTRQYQASDCNEQYSFQDYIGERVVTTGAMFLIGLLWALLGPYPLETRTTILLFVALKASESFSDVLGGRYQQQNRFDTACRILFLKTMLPLLGLGLFLAFVPHLQLALLLLLLLHIALTFLLDGAVLPLFSKRSLRPSFSKTPPLLLACLPLAIYAFLQMYLNNASRFVIHAQLGESATAAYYALSMASFVILLLAEFLIHPAVAPLSRLYADGNRKLFRTRILHIAAGILLIGALGLAGSWLCGIPILEACFDLDLSPWRSLLCLLFLAGALTALCQLSQLILVILRRQAWCLPAIGIAALIALVATPPLVRRFGLLGGGLGFFAAIFALLLTYCALALVFIHSRRTPSPSCI